MNDVALGTHDCVRRLRQTFTLIFDGLYQREYFYFEPLNANLKVRPRKELNRLLFQPVPRRRPGAAAAATAATADQRADRRQRPHRREQQQQRLLRQQQRQRQRLRGPEAQGAARLDGGEQEPGEEVQPVVQQVSISISAYDIDLGISLE